MIKSSLNLGLKPGLSMTPALQQAIRLLQMSTLDMRQEIQQMLDSNLMLENALDDVTWDVDDADGGDVAADDIPDDLPIDADWTDVYDEHLSPGSADNDLADFRQANLHSAPSLNEHLLWQADMAQFDATQRSIADYIIDAIDDRGYLKDWAGLSDLIVEQTGVTTDTCGQVLTTVQAFDPPGVAARDLGECLLIQLGQIDALDADHAALTCARQLVTDCLDRLGDHSDRQLATRTGNDEPTVAAARDLIRTLQPHPGSPFVNLDDQYVEPDIIVRKNEGKWLAALNPAIAPKLRINNTYQSLIKRGSTTDEQQTLKSHLQEARYFIGALRSRNDTLLRVAGCILDEQRAFFDYGEEAMRPLVLRDIATRLAVHESTVSRATTRKYMHTPRGLFELKYFFSSHVRTTEGGACSATAIQAMIRRLVGDEPPERPLSDSALARELNEQGIDVARRTVAKYREASGIPPSHERRRQARVSTGGGQATAN